MNVLLVAPTFTEEVNTMYFPIGMSYLASYIKAKGHSVDALNMNNYGLKHGLEILKEKLKNNNYDIIGIGAIIIAFERIEKLVEFVKKYSDAKIVLGGGVTSCETDIGIKTIKPDYMVVGEGERIFHELLEYIGNNDKALPKGVWVYENGDIVYASSESYTIEDLDSLPFPDYELLGIKKFLKIQTDAKYEHHAVDLKKSRSLPISASRSCPFKCTFCHHAGMASYRKHSVEYVMQFIKEMMSEYDISFISIYDELFSLNKQRVLDFCKELEKLKINFNCQLRVDQIDDEMLSAMKKAGCLEISFGIESGSQEVIDSMRKKTKVEQIKNALALTKKHKIGIQGNFLFGDPAETEETLQESIKFQEQNALFFQDWSMVIPYPGTDLHNLAISRGMIKDKDRVDFIRNVAETSRYLWNSPINLTNFSDKRYMEIYAYIRELNDINHRKVLTKINFSKRIDNYQSYLDVTCPNCKHRYEFLKFPLPLNDKIKINKDRESYYGFLGVNLVCPECRSKHHIIPKYFPHIKPLFDSFEKVFKKFIISSKNGVVVMPAVDRYFFAIKEDTKLFDIEVDAVLDSRIYRLEDSFLNKTTELLNKKNIKKYQDKNFIIYPWVEYQSAYSLLIENGIKSENILSWNMFDG